MQKVQAEKLNSLYFAINKDHDITNEINME